jgi:hypothetical protein
MKSKRDERRETAEKRNGAYALLTTAEKLARLPPAPQAARQRAKLEKQLAAEKGANSFAAKVKAYRVN